MIINATYKDLINEYVDRAPLTGQAYQADAVEVYIYIVKFTPGKSLAEINLVPHAEHNNGRLDFIALKNHYKEVGVHAISIVHTEKVIQDKFYVGEKIHICGGMNLKGS